MPVFNSDRQDLDQLLSQHWDVIVVGSGPAGGTLAWKLAQTGKRILLLERGEYLPRERENWNADEVFNRGRYQANETWFDNGDKAFKPGLHYFVGGNSKMYGAVLFRLRETDFGSVQHEDGASPAWPLAYKDFEPYYQAAEELFHVHGQRGEDPTEPPSHKPYRHEPIRHEKRIQQLADGLKLEGHQPFHLPVGVLLDQDIAGNALPHSACIRCDRFDGYPCLNNGKADAQIICIDPALQQYPNLTLVTGAYVSKLITNAAGTSVQAVEILYAGKTCQAKADMVVVACGALSSALLMLRSANDKYPSGLANSSGQVGRNYMRHNNSILLAVSKTPNDTRFQKTLGLHDFYHAPANGGKGDWEFPLGAIQMVGKSEGDQIKGEALPQLLQWFPSAPFNWLAKHSIDFWLTNEDLPRPENRIFYDGDKVRLNLTPTNMQAHRRLKAKLEGLCDKLDLYSKLFTRTKYFGSDIPIGGTAHQAGTLRFGTDPQTSVLDINCKAHDLHNLYVTDASFFPSIGAVNPTLTIIANALRVSEVIAQRIK